MSELHVRRTESTQTAEKLMKEQALHVHRKDSMSSMADIGRELGPRPMSDVDDYRWWVLTRRR